MADHTHQPHELYDVATSGDVSELRSYIDGLREDLSRAEERIRDLEARAGEVVSYCRASRLGYGYSCQLRRGHDGHHEFVSSTSGLSNTWPNRGESDG